MKKRVLNLSLLLLLSASFNASAMNADGTKFTEGTNAYVNVSNIVSGAGELISTATKSLEAASKAVVSGNEGIAQTAVNQAVDSIVNLDNIPPILLSSSPEIVKMTEKIGLLSKAFEEVPKTAYLKDLFCKSFAKLGNLPSLVNQNKTLTGVCAAGAVLAGYGVWKYLSSNKATASSEDTVLRSADTQKQELDRKIIELTNIDAVHNLGFEDGDPQGTLLMKYSRENNLPAVKYLISLGANPNIKDSDGRHLLVYPAFFGNTEIVEYLAKLANVKDKIDALNEARDIAKIAFDSGYYNSLGDETAKQNALQKIRAALTPQ